MPQRIMHDSNDEILAIRAELYQSDNKRAPLFRRLNALQSGTSVLPPETLSLVFQYFCAYCEPRTNYDPLHPSIFLGSISHAWRKVAWSTPQLWLILHLCPYEDDAKSPAELLDLYLTNARGISITLSIKFSDPYPTISEDDPVAQVFFRKDNLKKIGDLTLAHTPIDWLCRLDGPLSQLVKFHLLQFSGEVSLMNIPLPTNTPILREISFQRLFVLPKAPWPLITTLKLKITSFAVVAWFLLGSPNLVEFYSEQVYSAKEYGEELEKLLEIPHIFTLHHLETLLWSFTHSHTSDLFLHRIRLPALRSLTWDQQRRDFAGISPSGMRVFFQNLSSAPLTTLWLRSMSSVDIALAKHIYHQNPRIEILIFENCGQVTVKVALALLIPGWSVKEQANKRPYLIKLKKLELKGCVLESKDLSPELPRLELGDIIADLLIERASGGFDPSFGVHINTSGREIKWPADKMKKLRELNRSGVRVRLLKRGRKMDWL